MAKYTVTELSFIDNKLVQPGTVVEYAGEPGPNLEPVEDADDAADEPRKPGVRRTKPEH